MLQVRTGMLDAKKGAITAIREISEHCGAAFVPLHDQSAHFLQKTAVYWHPRIKVEVAVALPSFATTIIAADHGGTIKWENGVCCNFVSYLCLVAIGSESSKNY